MGKVFGWSHILTIITGFAKIAAAIIIFNVAHGNFETIVFALLIFIYSEVQMTRIHSLFDTNSLYEKLSVFSKTQSSINETDFFCEQLHGIISYIFMIIMRLICLFYFIKALWGVSFLLC